MKKQIRRAAAFGTVMQMTRVPTSTDYRLFIGARLNSETIEGDFDQLDGTSASARIGLPVPCSIFKGAASKIAPLGGS